MLVTALTSSWLSELDFFLERLRCATERGRGERRPPWGCWDEREREGRSSGREGAGERSVVGIEGLDLVNMLLVVAYDRESFEGCQERQLTCFYDMEVSAVTWLVSLFCRMMHEAPCRVAEEITV